jgi:DNA repair protein RadC
MSIRPHPRRVPRARIDPIDRPSIARRVIRAAMAIPMRPETLVLVLDDADRGLGIITVDGTRDPSSVVTVLECVAQPELFGGEAASLIVASIRPRGGIDPADGDRWFEMCDLAEQAGLELVEWFVIGQTERCPRDLTGAPPRWRGGVARSA